jgi:hypothetical protein
MQSTSDPLTFESPTIALGLPWRQTKPSDKALYNQRLMTFRPVRDYAIGPLIVAAVILGWLLALALLLYVATQK